MKHFIKFTALLTAVILLLGTVGCKDSYQNAIIYYEVPERPFTLDAQTASTDSELSIVKNIYEGLLRKNSSGAVVCGAAESFEKNGLKYTFKLRENGVWSNKEPPYRRRFRFRSPPRGDASNRSPVCFPPFCNQKRKGNRQRQKKRRHFRRFSPE